MHWDWFFERTWDIEYWRIGVNLDANAYHVSITIGLGPLWLSAGADRW